ncbi:MAG: tetratricopeptide repeat protein [Thaumarchaeota archaeon]|nr:tetratricopeptide repeat protein [Nitrososphaerota archaeon]
MLSGESKPADYRSGRPTVAILPFKNMSSDPENEYFSDGITEELITALSAVDGLKVISRTSVMQYKSSTKGMIEIARELSTDTLVEGSVRKAVNRVRIAVELIDGRDEGHLWTRTYDKELDDIFAVQSEIAEKVVEALKIELLDSERRILMKTPTSSSEAYTLYLKGRYSWNRAGKQGFEEAIRFYEKSVEQDPAFALGYAGLANAWVALARVGLVRPAAAYPKALTFALRALELDPDLGEARAVLGTVLFSYKRDPVRGEEELKRAIALNPGYAEAHMWYATLLLSVRRLSEALAEAEKAVQLDPLSAIANMFLGTSLCYLGEYDKAIEQLERTTRMSPNYVVPQTVLIQTFVRNSMYAEALKTVEDPLLQGLLPLNRKLMTAFVYAAMGNKEGSRGLMTEVEAGIDKEILSPYWVARVHFLLGDRDVGFNWLERAYGDDDFSVTRMGIDSEFDAVRSDPRYAAMLQRIGLGQTSVPETREQAAKEDRAARLASNLLKSGYRRVENKFSITLGETVSFQLVTYKKVTDEYIVCDYCERATKATIDEFIDKLNELASSNFDYKVRMGVMLSEREVPSDMKEYKVWLAGAKFPLHVVADPDKVNELVP